jgi:8-oxo-dGTP diphosphatase
MAQLPLDTGRLILRPYAQDDAPAVAALLNDPVMADFLMVIPHPFTDFDARTLVKAAWRRLTTGRGFDLLVVAKDGGAPVGSAGIGLHDEGTRGELGFWIGRAHWGQGYATEATARMVAFARDALAVPRITATATVDNAASRRVLGKLGFAETGRTEKTVASSGETREAILFELAARDEP